MDAMPALNPLLTEDVIPFLNVTHLGIESNKLEARRRRFQLWPVSGHGFTLMTSFLISLKVEICTSHDVRRPRVFLYKRDVWWQC